MSWSDATPIEERRRAVAWCATVDSVNALGDERLHWLNLLFIRFNQSLPEPIDFSKGQFKEKQSFSLCPKPNNSTLSCEENPKPTEAKPDTPLRHPDKPGRNRHDDILAAICNAKVPLTRDEIKVEMRLKTEGKLGGNLAWMVANRILINIPQRGYWPVDKPVPE